MHGRRNHQESYSTKDVAEQAQEMMGDAARMAEHHRLKMLNFSSKQAYRYIKSIVDSAEIVFGIWADRTRPDGFDSLIVKGRSLFAETVMRNESMGLRKFTAIPCNDIEQAIAAQQHFDTDAN